MITRENYEIFFLDYAEGNLNPSQVKELYAFLKAHPDLKQELEAYENITLPAADDIHDDKEELKKRDSWLINENNLEVQLDLYLKGKLKGESLREMELFLEKEDKNRKLVLVPAGEVFNEKELLKRDNGYRINAENCVYYFITYYEQPDAQLLDEIKAFIGDDTRLKNEFEAYGKLTLKHDARLLFEHKHTLKKKERNATVVIQFVRYSLAAAAAVALVFLLNRGEEGVYTPRAAAMAGIEKNITEDTIEMNGTPGIPSNNLAIKQQPQNIMPRNNFSFLQKQNQVQPQKKEPVLTHEEKPLLANDTLKLKSNIAHTSEKRSDTVPVPQHREEVAFNETGKENYVKPLDYLGSKVNQKYFNNSETEEGSGFLAMQNIVKKVSGGNAELNKKETGEVKEISFSIGNFQFQRKKSKN